jgi:pertussis toxin subunit 1
MFKRTAVYVRRRTRSRKTAFAAFFAALIVIALFQAVLSSVPAQAVSINDCPGGAYSGEGGPSCPDLHNDDTVNQRQLPVLPVYRGDSRLPYDIFTNGFSARGSNNDIQAHVQGDRAGNSNWISATGTIGVAESFARSQGLRNLETVAAQPRCSTGRLAFYAFIPVLGNFLLESCVNGTVTAESFVYVIDTSLATNASYVPDQIRGNPALYNHYASQDEWAYAHHIANTAIRGVRIYRMTAHANNGLISTRTITFSYDRFAGNPHYGQTRLVYNPGNDPSSNFNFESNLNTPELPANVYNRGCSSIDQCRGGS